MNILFLGPDCPTLINFLSSYGDQVISIEENLFKKDAPLLDGKHFIISYKYRYILKKDIVKKFQKRAINLHISFLPWNRGADPNLWSFLENTSKGVTIHYIDEGVDSGDILAQQEIKVLPTDTLRTTYDRLCNTIEDLFKQTWPSIRMAKQKYIPQVDIGSSHRLKDRKAFEHLLYKGWDTPVCDLVGKGLSKNA